MSMIPPVQSRLPPEAGAPITLVRLVLGAGPLSEKQVGYFIFKLAIFSGILAIITAFMMGIHL